MKRFSMRKWKNTSIMNYKIIILSLLLIILFSINYCYALPGKGLKETKIEGVLGQATGNEASSLEDVKKKAIHNAKIEALKLAGIEEEISSFQQLSKYETENEYNEFYSFEILSNIKGVIKDVEVVYENMAINEFGFIEVWVEINAVIVEHKSKRDLHFDFWTDGFKSYYTDKEKLKFSIKPTKNAYLKVFVFSENDMIQLYPNSYESSILLQANRQYFFPYRNIDYQIESDEDMGINHVLLVLLKEDIPFTKETTKKNVYNWIMTLPLDIYQIKTIDFRVIK
jgi:hypothetical protein